MAYDVDKWVQKVVELLEHVVAVESRFLLDTYPLQLTLVKALTYLRVELRSRSNKGL
jgi:hypothetical protein